MKTIENAEDVELVVAGPLHNNEETPVKIVTYVQQHWIPGVLPYLIPHEAAPGERFKGSSELGCHFPGDKNSDDPEDRVAAKVAEDLQPVATCLGIDPHDTPLKGSNYLCVPARATPEQLAIAIVLGLNKVEVMHNYPFFGSFPRFVSVETARDPASNPLSSPEYWHGKLSEIVSMGMSGLRRLFEQQGSGLTYFTKIPIPLIGKTALTMAQIEQLERIPVREAFEEVELPREIARQIGAEGEVTRVGSWNHLNQARVRLDLGVTSQGHPRREYFGSVYVRGDPPVVVDKSILQLTRH